MRVIHLGPGDVALGGPGDELRTVLGSCIALVLWEPRRRIAAMAHIALPTTGEEDLPRDTRRADHAWEDMCHALHRHGIDPFRCVCKVFGGARVLGNLGWVGQRNIEAVRRLLAKHRVPVLRANVGGTGYRELRMNVDTGDAWMRHRHGYVVPVERGGNP